MKIYIYRCLSTFAAFPAALGLGLGDIPKCAQPCADNLPSECNVLDVSCICKSSTWISGISCCVKTRCSEEDQQNTIEIATNLCKLYTTLPTAAICAATTAPSTAQSSGTSSSSAGLSSSTGTAALEHSSSSSVSASSKTATTTTAATTSSLASLTTTQSHSSPAAVSGAASAGHPLGQGIGAAGAAVFAFALL